MSGGLAREVSVVGLGVERGRGRAEEAMVMALGGFSLLFCGSVGSRLAI